MAHPLSATAFTNIRAAGRNLSAGETQLVQVEITNAATTAGGVFLQFFDAAIASVTLGTTVPLFLIYIPAAVAPATAVQYSDAFYPALKFTTRLSVFATTTALGSTDIADGVHIQAWVE